MNKKDKRKIPYRLKVGGKVMTTMKHIQRVNIKERENESYVTDDIRPENKENPLSLSPDMTFSHNRESLGVLRMLALVGDG